MSKPTSFKLKTDGLGNVKVSSFIKRHFECLKFNSGCNLLRILGLNLRVFSSSLREESHSLKNKFKIDGKVDRL